MKTGELVLPITGNSLSNPKSDYFTFSVYLKMNKEKIYLQFETSVVTNQSLNSK